MKVAISGASGKTGYRVAEEAKKSGHNVKLLVRPQSIIPDSLSSYAKSSISLGNQKELDDSLKGMEALVVATGARPSVDLTGPLKVDYLGLKSQVDSCKRMGVKRLILVSSLCAGRLIHPLNLFGLILIWKKLGEDYLRNSGLEWTIIRPGGLKEDESDLSKESIFYTGENKQEEGSIPRRLVAKCSVEALRTKESYRKVIEITSNQQTKALSLSKAITNLEL